MTSLCSVLVLGAGLMVAGPATTALADPETKPDKHVVFTGKITPQELKQLRGLGLDHEDISPGEVKDGKISIEVVLPQKQGEALKAKGMPIELKQVAPKARALAADGVYKPYSGPGGIREDIVAAAEAHPKIAKVIDIGTSIQGKPITAIRVTKNARVLPSPMPFRPAVVLQATQHAREWITPENVRRQLHHFLNNYGTDANLTKLIDTTDVYFIPVVNVDGYDLTHSDEDYRLWRKNAHDNNGDGQLTTLDGVDPNRNFGYKWGYDNEGSSPSPDSQTYRGTGPMSEPETKAQDAFVKKIKPKFMINYHSAAELLLYGVGWQAQTPSPDDNVWEALLGHDEHPAVPGYDPDLGAELYITNGDTDGHMDHNHGVLTMTPEMSTCQTVSASDPNDEWLPEDCASVFNFPDDEGLIQAEFEKNLPLALATVASAHNPDEPVSVVGLSTPDFKIDPFKVSYGKDQPVSVEMRRSIVGPVLRYKINGGSTKVALATEWKGGEKYGDSNDHYFAEFRGTVKGAKPGDSVEVWFEGLKKLKKVSSEHFTYTVSSDTGSDILIVSGEDVTGLSPAQGVTTSKYAATYEAALTKAGYSSDVYDVDAQGRTAPHHLGVLSHYKAIVWETGDDVITRAVGQVPGTAAKLHIETELNVRDYLNEGGKLVYTGKYAGFTSGQDGAYLYQPNVPAQPECTDVSAATTCLPLLNDFLQYYLGAFTYVDGVGQDENGDPYPVKGVDGKFNGFASTLNGGDSANNQNHTASFLTTSSFLPPAEFPQFASSAPVKWDRPGGAPFDPKTGDWYAFSHAADVSYKRLSKTVDLTGKADGKLTFQTSFDTEANWDYMFVEARTEGQDDWTTLPELGGHTSQDTGQSCASNWAHGPNAIHPFLAHYQGADCSPTGTTGTWNAASGRSNGWQEWNLDLTPYAGKKVELSISYVSDWGTQGIGVFVDDVQLTSGGAVLEETSFEADFGGWTATGPAEGSGPNANDWGRTQKAFEEGAGVVTEDTVFVGFGAEGLTTLDARAEFLKRSLEHLLD